MIRHKHTSTSTGDGASITVATPPGFSNDATTVRAASIGGCNFDATLTVDFRF